ncbi:unnamed protein product [Adineta ricciae]|uniref:Uncharacterized protein n=1 Tax=Adineta ricciae TaxID=249248 RepID=A0A814XCG0_ADIRI|nr:unnamed protein product [Adineta ricciae]CAF1313454.1 unnamed protein product [Adineta ricciae]
MSKIYVLACKERKYYVGKSSNVERRFEEHIQGDFGSEWTRQYEPLRIVQVKDMTTNYDEANTTLDYMKKYGIDNVRGAQWSNMILTNEQRDTIQTMMNPNACFRCGLVGHFANECYRNVYKPSCKRCGRDTHSTRGCYASFDIDGNQLECARCGRDSHVTSNCFAKTDIEGQLL